MWSKDSELKRRLPVAAALQSSSGHHCMLRSQWLEWSLHQIIDHYVKYAGPGTTRAEKSLSVHNQNSRIVNVWFYQFLLHKRLIDLFEYARIIKKKKRRLILFGANSPHVNSSCLLQTYHQAYASSHSSSESLSLVKVVNPQDFCCWSQDSKWGL